MNDQFVLRRADISDIDALSQLSQRTFRETYVEDFSISYLNNYLDDYYRSSTSPEWFTKKIGDPQRAIWIIEHKRNGEFVAYAVAGPCAGIPHPDIQPNQDAELDRFYIQRDRQGHGFGKQLMNAVLLWFKEHYPRRPVWLSVWSENFKAQKFYASYGFNKVGEFCSFIGEWKDREFVMKLQSDRQ